MGPAPATRLVLQKAGLTLADIDLIEINEAFAAQYLAVEKDLGLDRERVNVNGGAIALGHPLGMTGTRLLLTLALELRRRGLKRGLAAACIGGGQGIAAIIEACVIAANYQYASKSQGLQLQLPTQRPRCRLVRNLAVELAFGSWKCLGSWILDAWDLSPKPLHSPSP